ncbi:MAG TPA: PHP domain-containing protein [Candidatus Saccharimonas sp.]|nr:PHP domain-containing protein [Candidatus Saccharimonas sp.]
MFTIDLHTHSQASPDGALTLADYERSPLDFIAITDHDRIDFALGAKAKLGAKIIVGEEITTRDGELIGLFLTHAIPPKLSATQTITAIKKQGGLVYVPHPFETVRKGVQKPTLDAIAKEVDIIETHNGRAVFQNYGCHARTWVKEHEVAAASSSDAHGPYGWNRTYSFIAAEPTTKNLPDLLRTANKRRNDTVGLGILYPKINRLRRHHA